MKYIYYLSFVALLLNSCIGNDIEQDFVEPKIRISNLSENPIPEKMSLFRTHSFSAVFFNDIGEKIETPITWSSSNLNVIKINDKGLANAVGIGESTIYASVENDNPNFSSQEIIQKIATIKVFEVQEGTLKINNPRTSNISIENTYDYNVDFLGTNLVEWSSSNPLVATIDKSTGLVTAKSTGTTTITVSVIENGKILTDTTILNVIRTIGRKAILSGSYGLSGSVELTSTGLVFSDDFSVGNAPGGYFYLSNNPNSIGAARKVGERISAFSGAWTIPLNGIGIGDYRYIIFWCDPFNAYLGGAEFK